MGNKSAAAGNSENRTPLDYGRAAADTMMRKFAAADLPPKGRFHYHQGVFLSGVYKMYRLSGREEYFQYVKDWVDAVTDADGRILHYDPGQLDDIQPGILLFPLYERTGDERYRKILDHLADLVKHFPRNEAGGFFHKANLPDQMWLDGLYMGGPICAEYASRFGRPEFLEIAVEQALLMREKTEDKKTGLWHHAWDYSKRAPWADPETGLSPEFWGRAMGWVPVAVLDELDFVPKDHPRRGELCALVRDLLTALCRYQSGEGRWYQVVDKGGQEGNWLENSCSCLYVAAICKAVRNGILGEAYLRAAERGYRAVIRSLDWDGPDIRIGNVCVGTGVGDYAHYCARPVSVNDLHGVGAFLIMCAEMQETVERGSAEGNALGGERSRSGPEREAVERGSAEGNALGGGRSRGVPEREAVECGSAEGNALGGGRSRSGPERETVECGSAEGNALGGERSQGVPERRCFVENRELQMEFFVPRSGQYLVTLEIRPRREMRKVRIFARRRRLCAAVPELAAGETFRIRLCVEVCDVIPRAEEGVKRDLSVDVNVLAEEPFDGDRVRIVSVEETRCPVIHLAGDSTVTDQPADRPCEPETNYSGWGQMLPYYLQEGVAVANHAYSGLTTETFRELGFYGIIENCRKPGDYLFLQFGHNDQKHKHLRARGGYRDNLARYIEENRRAGLYPVLVTPLARNTWHEDGSGYHDLLEANAAVCLELGKEMDVPVLDLHGVSMNDIMVRGRDAVKPLFVPGDYTHTNICGAQTAAFMVASEMKRVLASDAREAYRWLAARVSDKTPCDEPRPEVIRETKKEFHTGMTAEMLAEVVWASEHS